MERIYLNIYLPDPDTYDIQRYNYTYDQDVSGFAVLLYFYQFFSQLSADNSNKIGQFLVQMEFIKTSLRW